MVRMQRTSTTVVAVLGGEAALLTRLGRAANVRAVTTDEGAPPLERAAAAWDVVTHTATPYLVHDADPLAAVAQAWVRRFDGIGPHGELELAVAETLTQWRQRAFELPDYYLLIDPSDWPATERHWFLGVLAPQAPMRVLVADPDVSSSLPRLPTGRWWPELDQLVAGIEQIVPDQPRWPGERAAAPSDAIERPTVVATGLVSAERSGDQATTAPGRNRRRRPA
jgi:hypothetical protein